MANFNIAFDNLDVRLGSYFEESKTSIVNFITAHNVNHTVHEMPSASCNPAYINPYLQGLNGKPFLFIAYSHGSDHSLVAQDAWYVNSPENTEYFQNSFFYSMACNTGKIMAGDLIAKGCLGFIGYNSTAYAAHGAERQIFIDCDNFALKRFIEGATMKVAFDEMKLFFRESIKELVRNKKGLLAGYLRRNYACLVIEGEDNLVFSKF